MNKASSVDLDRLTMTQALVHDILSDVLEADSDKLDATITLGLGQLGQFVDVDRAYVFRIRGDAWMDNTHEWCAQGITPMIDDLQDLPLDVAAKWMPDLSVGRPIWITDVDGLPDDAPEKEVLQPQGVKSIYIVPMLTDGKLSGFAGYDAVRGIRNFAEVEKLALRSIASAIHSRLETRDAARRTDEAMAALANESNRLAATLETIPDLVVEFDAGLRIVNYHPGTTTVQPEIAQALIGNHVRNALQPEVADDVTARMTHLGLHGGSVEMDIDLDLGAGERTFLAHGRRRVDAAGQLLGFVVVLRDITDRRANLREVMRLSEIARRTTNMALVIGNDLCVQWANPAFVNQSGWTLTEVIGRTPYQLLAGPDTDPQEMRRVDKALRNHEPIRTQLLCARRNGVGYWIDFDIQPLRATNWAPEGFMAVGTVISALKEAEQRAITERGEALQASRDGIALTGVDGRYVYFNSAYRTLFGIADNVDPLSLNWADLHNPDSSACELGTGMSVASRTGGWSGELQGYRLDNGAVVTQEVTLSQRSGGGLLWIARDISARRAAAAERARLLDELSEAQRRAEVGVVAAGVAHDVNNLLITIGGSAELAREVLPTDHPSAEHLKRIVVASRETGAVLKRLLSLGKRPILTDAVNLTEPVELAAHLVRTGLPDGVRLRVSTPDGPALARSESRAVVQIVMNLLINARDALAAEGGDIALSVASATRLDGPLITSGVQGDGPYWRLAIMDTGPGMDADTAARIFEPYFSTKGEGGTGIGLAVVKAMVSDTGGALKMHTAPGYGTRFEVFWPKA